MWKEQYDRMYRGAEKLRIAYRGRSADKGYGAGEFPAFRDSVIHLFQDIFHLRDWLINDAAIQIPDAELYALFKGHMGKWPALHVARDVANGSKHLTVDNPSQSADAKVARTGTVSVEYGGERGSHLRQGISVQTDTSSHEDALALCERCLTEWNGFLKSKGLL